MPMRDYEELKNVKIPAEQERIMDIICDAWEECRDSDCPCDHDLPSKHSMREKRIAERKARNKARNKAIGEDVEE